MDVIDESGAPVFLKDLPYAEQKDKRCALIRHIEKANKKQLRR